MTEPRRCSASSVWLRFQGVEGSAAALEGGVGALEGVLELVILVEDEDVGVVEGVGIDLFALELEDVGVDHCSRNP